MANLPKVLSPQISFPQYKKWLNIFPYHYRQSFLPWVWSGVICSTTDQLWRPWCRNAFESLAKIALMWCRISKLRSNHSWDENLVHHCQVFGYRSQINVLVFFCHVNFMSFVWICLWFWHIPRCSRQCHASETSNVQYNGKRKSNQHLISSCPQRTTR